MAELPLKEDVAMVEISFKKVVAMSEDPKDRRSGWNSLKRGGSLKLKSPRGMVAMAENPRNGGGYGWNP